VLLVAQEDDLVPEQRGAPGGKYGADARERVPASAAGPGGPEWGGPEWGRAGQAPLAGSSTNTGICREVFSWYSAYGG
jgi:hypothetical protein